jgi:F-type H+-transporting ATPase subunit b
MDDILSQLGGLLLGAVPTVIFMVLLYGFYAVVVHKPLAAVLAERHRRTEGAIEKARADIAAAEARTADYERRLREARAAIFKGQERRRQQALQARAAALAEARDRALAQVGQARDVLEKEKLSAQASLSTEATGLATEIIRSVLRPAVALAPASAE